MKHSIIVATCLASAFALNGCGDNSQSENNSPQTKMKARFVTAAEKFRKASVRLDKIDDRLQAIVYGVDMEDTENKNIVQRHDVLIDIADSVLTNYKRMKIPPVQACEDIRTLRNNLPPRMDNAEIQELRNPPALMQAQETEKQLSKMREELVPMIYRSNVDLVKAEEKLTKFETAIEPFVRDMTPPQVAGKPGLSPLELKIEPVRERLAPLYNWQQSFYASLNPCENIAATLNSAQIAQKRVP